MTKSETIFVALGYSCRRHMKWDKAVQSKYNLRCVVAACNKVSYTSHYRITKDANSNLQPTIYITILVYKQTQVIRSTFWLCRLMSRPFTSTIEPAHLKPSIGLLIIDTNSIVNIYKRILKNTVYVCNNCSHTFDIFYTTEVLQ